VYSEVPRGRSPVTSTLQNVDARLDDALLRTLITVCTYNERENVATLVPALRQHCPSAVVLVVDDNSPDGTADVVRQFGAKDPNVQLLLRMHKAGLGAATIAAFQHGIEHNYDVVVNLDADWSHPPDVVPRLLAALSEADVAIASRYTTGGRIEGWSWARHFMSRGINWYTRLLLRLTLRDCSGAFRAYRVEKLRQIDFSRIRSRGYAFQEEILFRCRAVGCRFVEVPYTFVDRLVGQSKINHKEMVRALWDIACLSVERRVSFSRDPPGSVDGAERSPTGRG
jgi:dolichol-phosphate mannosyltransferase